MPLNPDAVGAVGEPRTSYWTSKDCLLYALGVGAGAVDPLAELEPRQCRARPDDVDGIGQRGNPLPPRPLPEATGEPIAGEHAPTKRTRPARAKATTVRSE